MSIAAAIFRTMRALLNEALADLRIFVLTTGPQPCYTETSPPQHEPSLYDTDLVMSALISYMLLIPCLFIVTIMINGIIARKEAYLYWQYRTFKRWYTGYDHLTPTEQKRMALTLCPDIEVRVRASSQELQVHDEGFSED